MSRDLNFLEVEEVEREPEVLHPPVVEEKREEPNAHEVKRIVEAVLFAAKEPLTLGKLREVVTKRANMVEAAIAELQEEYRVHQRAFQLEEIGEGFLLRTKPEYGLYIQRLYHGRQGEKLSPAASEVLAIIAYRQPITRPGIEAIRGVDSSGTTQALVERGLIEKVGRLEAPGRPGLYGTTARFLQHFGLKDLSELPPIE